MPKYIRNKNKVWSQGEVNKLRELVSQNTPTRVIGLKLGRPVNGVYAKADQLDISLQPPNRSPYNRRTK